jgi:glutamyl-Q tRNA(Asp) synthetase
MTMRTRFAPSPNGSLHLGHAYAALVAHDLARAAGGEFLLRIEDIDAARSRPELIAEFHEDLEWLGLSWDMEVLQSTRLGAHALAARRLREMGLLYPCQCSRAEIAAAAKKHGPDGLIYPGTCKRNPPLSAEGAAWRLDMEKACALAGPLWWEDAIAGRQRAEPEKFGDVVLVRKEAPSSYHLSATLDDAADAITLVTRGMDLFEASHLHRLLQALLGLPVPRWHHHPLLTDPDGRKLAKRKGSPSLTDRRRAGEDGIALATHLRAGQFPAGICLSASVRNEP